MLESLAAVHTQSLSLFHLCIFQSTKHSSFHKKVLGKWFRKGGREKGREDTNGYNKLIHEWSYNVWRNFFV